MYIVLLSLVQISLGLTISLIKKGGMCSYYKENVSQSQLDISYFFQSFLCEVKLKSNIGYVTVMYRSPSQTANEFNDFHFHFDWLLNQVNKLYSSFLVILADFNARFKSWPQTKYLTTNHGLHQLISDPTHLLPNLPSCIDLIFIDHPNLYTDCGVHAS